MAHKRAILGATLATAFLVGCGSDTEQSQIDYCSKLAQAAHRDVGDFTVGDAGIGRFSEGTMVSVAITYTDPSGEPVATENKCWFGGKEKIREFHIDRGGNVEKVSRERLDALIAEVGKRS
jgi:hypothetical protein